MHFVLNTGTFFVDLECKLRLIYVMAFHGKAKNVHLQLQTDAWLWIWSEN